MNGFEIIFKKQKTRDRDNENIFARIDCFPLFVSTIRVVFLIIFLHKSIADTRADVFYTLQ